MQAPGYLSKGLSMMGALRSADVPIRRGVHGLRVTGKDRAERVEYEAGGVRHAEPAEIVLLHQGVVPNVNLALSLRCEHVWDDRARCFRPKLDAWGASSVAGSARRRRRRRHHRGEGLGAVRNAGRARRGARRRTNHGRARRDRRGTSVRKELARHLDARPFLEALYRPEQEYVAHRAIPKPSSAAARKSPPGRSGGW